MSEPQVAQQFVLMDVEPVAAGSGQAKLPVDKTFRRYDQDQPMLLAPDLRDWLAADHPARWVDELVEHGLDLSAVYADYTEVRGAPPYDCLLYTSDAADDLLCVDLGGRRIIK